MIEVRTRGRVNLILLSGHALTCTPDLFLVVSENLSAIAAQLAEAMARCAEFVEAKDPDTDKERALRQALAQSQFTFVNTARKMLGLRQIPVPWPLGGPPPDRPVQLDPRSVA
jgi:hypothetical protein